MNKPPPTNIPPEKELEMVKGELNLLMQFVQQLGSLFLNVMPPEIQGAAVQIQKDYLIARQHMLIELSAPPEVRARHTVVTLATSPELIKQLELAKDKKLSRRDVWMQRLSFVFGNLPEGSNLTREQVTEMLTEMCGPCPEEVDNVIEFPGVSNDQ